MNIFKLPAKLNLGLKIIAKVSNWHILILDYLGLIHKEYYFLILRDGLKFKIRSNDGDKNIFTEVMISEDYPLKIFKSKAIIVDLGAHVGFFSILFGKYNPKAIIYAYEPHPENFKILAENISLNSMNNVFVINKAVSSRKGRLNFYLTPSNSGQHSLVKRSPIATKVESVTLPEIFKNNRISEIDLLKIDIEGAEYRLFYDKKNKQLIQRIKEIYASCHRIDKNKCNIDSARQFFEKVGFKVNKYSNKDYLHIN